MREWQHDELQADLVLSRNGVGEAVAENLSLGIWGSGGEIDVWAMRLSRTKPRPTVYEVKVTRADFLADVREGKHRRYELAGQRYYFATPSGLVDRREVPDGWGLTVRGENGWHSLKASRLHPESEVKWRPLMMAVVLSLHPGPWADPGRAGRINTLLRQTAEDLAEWIPAGRRVGRRVKAIADEAAEAQRAASDARHRIRRVARALGIDPDDFDRWGLDRAIEDRAEELGVRAVERWA